VADYFFDSSALVKAYIDEAGTNWVRTILDDPQHRILISALAEVEVTSALTRRFREGDLTEVELDQACEELTLDCATYILVEVTRQILEAAVSSARTHSLRAYDAIQLASAIAVRTALLTVQGNANEFAVVSADKALNDAARLEELQVEDPNVH
jgi:predicted nucleic acid-binding protein